MAIHGGASRPTSCTDAPSRAGGVRVAAVLLVLALVVRLAFVAGTPGYTPAHDDAQYDRLACAIVAGPAYPRFGPQTEPRSCGAFERRPERPSAYRPPGQPAFLAGVYVVSAPISDDRWTAARVAQALLGTALVALVALVALQLWGQRTGLLTLALGAVYVPLVVVGASLLAETLFVTLLVAAVAATLAAARSRHAVRWLALAGGLVGLAGLTRANGLLALGALVFGAVAAVQGTRRARLTAAAVLVGAAVVVVAPWTIRNAVQLGGFVPVSTHAGSALAGTYNDAARTRTDHPGAWTPPARVPALADVLSGRDEIAAQRALTRRALAYAAEHPGYVVEVSLRNTQRMLHLEGVGWSRGNAEAMSLPPSAGDVAAYTFFGFAALAVAGALTGAARRAPRWLWALPAVMFASVVPVAGEMRFRAPADPFILMLAALALAAGVAGRFGRYAPR